MIAPDAPVVVGADKSARSLWAVRLAAREAAAHGRPLCILHAFNWAAAPDTPSAAGPRTDAERVIERAVEAAIEVEPELTIYGEIAEGAAVATLVRRAESAFLVAIGDSGMARSGHISADAPAIQLAARADCPVLVVRPEPPPQGPVLAGVDGSASSRIALDFAFGCAARRSARLLVVRVTEPDRGDECAADDLADTVRRCGRQQPSVPVEQHTIRGDPGTVLVEQSRSTQLVVAGARGDEPWRGMLGAVSQALLYHSPAPVIIVRGLTDVPLDGA